MGSHVDLAGGGLGEAPVADGTLVRSLARVDPDVLLEPGLLGEVLAARVTPVRSHHLRQGGVTPVRSDHLRQRGVTPVRGHHLRQGVSHRYGVTT